MKGLTKEQVESSRREHGANVLTPPKRESLIVRFIRCFDDPIIKILLIALLLSIGISVYEFVSGNGTISLFFQPVGILLAVLLATLVGFILNLRNEKTFQALNAVNDDTPVKVIRDGNVTQVPRRDIVVGDIVLLETGDEIPADSRLLESFNLIVNESSLTGEPQCNKYCEVNQGTSAWFAEGIGTGSEPRTSPQVQGDAARHVSTGQEATYPADHILKGCTIIEGYCTAEVFAVGDSTESGHVFTAAQVSEGNQTPLGAKLNKLADLITKISYSLAALIIIGRVIHFFIIDPPIDGYFNWLQFTKFALDTIMIAVTLIVVAVPEGLPMAVNLSLAFSMKRLMRENTLPRTIHACETMGAATVICTDKTGTLTRNQMQVAEWKTTEGADDRVAEAICVNSTANLDFSNVAEGDGACSVSTGVRTIGNPTEGALLMWLWKTHGSASQQGYVSYQEIREGAPMLDRQPFTTELKYMTTTVTSAIDGRPTLYIKGAPEIIVGMCDLTEDERNEVTETLASMQNRAMRTIAVAYTNHGVVDSSQLSVVSCQLSVVSCQLTLLGIFGISDPVRDEVPGAIARCHEAGIDVKIVTGDVVGTAREIGRQCGIISDETINDKAIMTGAEFATMSDEELKERLPELKILSRARPADKQRLVHLLRDLGNVVAVTGDGTNDAPALNAADVGLSMGDGTAVAKEASDMTILDNSFGSICNTVIWGRSLYKNIQRFVMFQMTINVVACLVVLIGAFVGAKSPLTVTQMLWVNLIMDTFAALALASLPPSADVMHERPRRSTDSILSRGMVQRIFGVGGIFLVVLIALMFFFKTHDVDTLTDITREYVRPNHTFEMTTYELSLFFTIFVMLQFWNMFNARAFMTGHSAFHNLRECHGFIWIALVILVGQILIVTFGGAMFSVTPLVATDWLIIIAVTSLVLIIPEIYRAFSRKKK